MRAWWRALLLLLLLLPGAASAEAPYDCGQVRYHKLVYGMCRAYMGDYRGCNFVHDERLKLQCLAIARKATAPCYRAPNEPEKRACLAIVRGSVASCTDQRASDAEEAWCRGLAHRTRAYCSRAGVHRRSCERVIENWQDIDDAIEARRLEASQIEAGEPVRPKRPTYSWTDTHLELPPEPEVRAASTPSGPRPEARPEPAEPEAEAEDEAESSLGAIAELNAQWASWQRRVRHLVDTVSQHQEEVAPHCPAETDTPQLGGIPPALQERPSTSLSPVVADVLNHLRSFRGQVQRTVPRAQVFQGGLHRIERALHSFDLHLHRVRTCADLHTLFDTLERDVVSALGSAPLVDGPPQR